MARTNALTNTVQRAGDFDATAVSDLQTKLNEHDAALDALGAPGVGSTLNKGAISGRAIGQVVDSQTSGGVAIRYVFAIPDAAGDVDYDIVVDEKIEVFDARVIKSGAGAGNTVTVKNGATAISDAMAAAVDKTVTRAGTIDPAQSVINAAGTLRVTAHRAAGTMLAKVIVDAIKRA